MLKTKEQILEQINIKVIKNFLMLSGIATFLPFLIHFQWITGPIVNAVLIITLFLAGLRSAFVVALIPSVMALSGGLLPVVLAPVVPFIMISNVILVITVDFFYNKIKDASKGYWYGIIFGALVKFIFLLLSTKMISSLLIKQELIAKVVQMMSWSQFFTAFTGGLIAFIVLKFLKRI